MDEVIAISVAAIMVRVHFFDGQGGGIPETTFPTSLVERKKKAKDSSKLSLRG